jgi:hypothetical protein
MSSTKLLVILAVLAVAAAGGYLGFSQFGRLCTGLAIRDFLGHPSAEGAQTLAELVDNGSATAQQIERILPLLLTPKITKDKAYVLGDVPKIRVELPFELTFSSLAADVNESVWIDGRNQYGTGMQGAHLIRTNSHALHLYPAPTTPGTYTMEIRYTYLFRCERRRTWQWNPAQRIFLPRPILVDVADARTQAPKYECRITVPVEIRVVRKVQLQTSP